MVSRRPHGFRGIMASRVVRNSGCFGIGGMVAMSRSTSGRITLLTLRAWSRSEGRNDGRSLSYRPWASKEGVA